MTLNTYLQPMGRFPWGKETRLQVLLVDNATISSLIALSHSRDLAASVYKFTFKTKELYDGASIVEDKV